MKEKILIIDASKGNGAFYKVKDMDEIKTKEDINIFNTDIELDSRKSWTFPDWFVRSHLLAQDTIQEFIKD